MSPHSGPDVRNAASRAHRGSLWLLYTCTVLIIVCLAGAELAVLLNLREATLRDTRTNLRNISLALAEQADRSVQGLDLVLSSVAEFATAEGAGDATSFQELMASRRVHQMLREKLTGLPYINAITLINADGNLINFSRFWPLPLLQVTDREFFRVMRNDLTLRSFISEPVRNHIDGAWAVYLARGAPSRDGSFTGLLLGAIDLKYFADFYRTMSLGDGSAISLMRQDGVLLARYPSAKEADTSFPLFGPRALQGGAAGIIRDVSPVDGTMRIKAAYKLANFPLFVLVTQTEATALRDWTRVVWVLSVITAGCAGAILFAALTIARWWRQQHALGQERADRAEAEHARAVAEADLLRERERHAEEANRAKSGFLAMMSHEIRTPMNAVLGLAGTLLDDPLEPAQRKVVEAIRGSGDDLLRILNDILDLSKLDAGRMTFEAAPFSPATLTQNAVSILGPCAAAKGLSISADADPALPEGLLGDAGRVRQVLLNLVSNAVKFTSAGSVTIRAHCLAREGDTTTVEWLVRDTGIGISADRIGSLFGEFVQADGSISRRFGGSGLGLAISKRLVAQMGGTIAVESEPGTGTTFCVRLTFPVTAAPLAVPPTQRDTVRSLHTRLAALRRPLRILFAEDNATNQFVALQMLKEFDIQVDVVGDGLEAVDAASRFTYDLICMDMRMPEMDGLAATRLIRKQGGALTHIPIIALTANAFPEDVKACFDAGMDQFIPKPVSKEVLLSAILYALPDDPEAAANRAPVARATPKAVIAATAMEELLADLGNDGVSELLSVFARETRHRLQRMAGGATTHAAMLHEMHTLKGAAGTVCAASLAQLATTLEQRLKAGERVEATDIEALSNAFDAYLRQMDVLNLCSIPMT